jgi:hypothetical protein
VSIGVDVNALAGELERFGVAAFVMTAGEEGRPHISHVALRLDHGALRCEIGRRTAANARLSPHVAILWPPYESGGYSLIVDADATVDGTQLQLTPTRAVLHRPAPSGDGSAAASDCHSPDRAQ